MRGVTIRDGALIRYVRRQQVRRLLLLDSISK
jgi:hypothetical protein